MRRRSLLLLPLLAALLSPLAAAGPTEIRADVVRLRTGEAVKCRPIKERSDDRTLVVEDLLSGSIRAFAWEALEPTDRHRIKVDWNQEGDAEYTIVADRLVLRVGDDESELYGLVEKEDATTVFLRRNGDVTPVPAAEVVGRSKESLDRREIWNPAQLMEQFLKDLRDKGVDPASPSGPIAWQVAVYAEWAGALEQALEAYRRAAADPDFLQKAVAEQRVARVEALIRDKSAMDSIRDMKTKLASNQFLSVRKGLEGFAAAHPGASEAVTKALEDFKKVVAQKRLKYLRQRARWEFVKICQRLVEAKVKERDVKLQDAKSFQKKELKTGAFEALRLVLEKIDTLEDKEEEKLWETRWEGINKGSWLKRGYGAGTFVVYQPQIQPPKPKAPPPQKKGSSHGSSSKSQPAAPNVTLPKPPTADEWWASASPTEKASWVMAYFAQNSGLFEVSRDLDNSPCPTCNGTGVITRTTQTGADVSYLCTRCAGAAMDKTVKFR